MFWPDNEMLEQHMKLGAAGLVSTTVIFHESAFEAQIRHNMQKLADQTQQLMLNIIKEKTNGK